MEYARERCTKCSKRTIQLVHVEEISEEAGSKPKPKQAATQRRDGDGAAAQEVSGTLAVCTLGEAYKYVKVVRLS